MKKQFITLVALVVGFLTSSIAVYGQKADFDVTSDPGTWYYVTLQAQPSTPACGSNPGTVVLRYTNPAGEIENPWITTTAKPTNPNTEGTAAYNWEDGFSQGGYDSQNGKTKNHTAYDWFTTDHIAGYEAGYDWVEAGEVLNTTNPTAVGTSVSLRGYTTIYSEGMDDVLGMSSYAYYHATAQENDGWYFVGWSYTDGASDLGGTVGVEQQFKVLPSPKTGVGNIMTKYLYATFLPVQVADYKVSGLMNVGVAANASAQTTIVYDVIGERVSEEDFTVSVTDANFAAVITSCEDNKVTVTVTYTNPASDVQTGEFRENVTLTSKSGCSQLTAPVYARVGETAATDATLYDGKTQKNTGTLAEMIAAIGDCTEPIIALNKDYATALTTTSTFTLDLNGYNLSQLTVSGGELTVAYSKYGGNINSTVAVNSGKLILNGGTIDAATGVTVAAGATLEQNGATITATGIAIENSGTTIINEGEMVGTSTAGVKSYNGTLIINGGTISGAYALWVAGGTADVTKGTLTGTNYGIYSQGTTTTEKLATISGGTNAVRVASGTTTIKNGKFDSTNEEPLAVGSGTLNLQSGYFKTNDIGVTIPSGKKIMNVSAGTEYNAGYRYFVGDDENAQSSGVGVCKIGTTAYATLEDALAYANNNPDKEVVIIMLNNYVLPAGYYTLPAKATLVVPMSDTQETAYSTVNRVSNNGAVSTPYVQPYEFRRLTFASGVNMEVFGTIELSGTQRASDEAYASMPHGAYGHLVMSEGAKMTLQNGSTLRAWGYVTGKGETDARRGSTVCEQFQMGDWKGGSASFSMLEAPEGVFPITQYFIQNIESPVKYHPGAVLSATASVSAVYGGLSVTAQANNVKIIGVTNVDEAMFLMDNMADAENTWVRKWYDAENDVQTYEVNSGAHIGSMVLDLGKLGTDPLKMNSGAFVLPITNNMKIHLLSGFMDFTQNTALLPGAEVEVDKKSVVSISKNIDATVQSGSLYIYDAAQWGQYAYPNKYTKVVKYAASKDAQPTKRSEDTCPASASINVHGTFDTGTGYIYTSAGGANIFSTNADAGTFVFSTAASEDTETVYQKPTQGEGGYIGQTFVPALLKNGDATYTNTAGTEIGMSYCYMDNAWRNLTYMDCYAMDLDFDLLGELLDEGKTDLSEAFNAVYIKPQEFIRIATKTISVDEEAGLLIITGNDDHTYSDAAGDGRLFILSYDAAYQCQWWEVEKKDNLYHCIHPENDTYYYWDETEQRWLEKRYTITWQDWDGKPILSYDEDNNEIDYTVPYGTMAEYLGTNPTRKEDIDYTYDFTGWSPELSKVTSDVTYTATYTKKERKYTIIFLNEGGVEIERQFLTHNAVPVCENMPTKVGHYLEWQPAIAAVTRDATYTAKWLEEKPSAYTITFVDYDGTTELQSGEVTAGETPVYNGATPTGKSEDDDIVSDEYTYVFDRWSPAIAAATQDMTYTAVYKEVEKTYTISYYEEDGTTLITTETLPYGATPTPPSVTKENTAQYTYTLVWTPQIQTVMGDVTYRASFTETTNKYTVTLKSNNDAVCTFTGAGIYDYGTFITIGVNLNSSDYVFTGWKEDNTLTQSFETTIAGDITLTAMITKNSLPNLELDGDDVKTITAATDVQDLVITSTGTSSSQIKGAANLKVWGEAYFDLVQTMNARTWYAVAVPWQVDATTGIYDAAGNHLALGAQIDIIAFDSEAQALDKDNRDLWQYVEYQSDKTLYPGKLYMMYLLNDQSKIRFQRKMKAAVLTETTSVQTYPSTIGDQYANWNGIANPALYYAYLNAGGTHIAQSYNPGADTYSPIALDNNALIVAQPVFVQAPNPKTVIAAENKADAVFAPRRMAAAIEDANYTVEISQDGVFNDRLFIATTEEKENTYVIGQDVMKMGVSTNKAQMWIEQYDVHLCMHTQVSYNAGADYPLTLAIPSAGEYTISTPSSSANTNLYLTRNGEVIWSLSEGAYILHLEQGTTTEYGLRIGARSPQIATGVDQVQGDKTQATKLLIDNKLYILCGEKMYDAQGKLVK